MSKVKPQAHPLWEAFCEWAGDGRGEPVTEEWLRSIGFVERHWEQVLGTRRNPKVRTVTRFCIGHEPLHLCHHEGKWLAAAGGLEFPDPGVKLADPKTRADVLNLLSALGIKPSAPQPAGEQP